MKKRLFRSILFLAPLALWLAAAAPAAAGEAAADWWKAEWSGRTKFTLDPAAEGAEIKGEAGDTVLLVRLHPGNLPFEAAQADGSDLRFVSADGEVLPFHLEKFDPLMAEGFAWVRVPSVGSTATDFFLYYGNPAPEARGRRIRPRPTPRKRNSFTTSPSPVRPRKTSRPTPPTPKRPAIFRRERSSATDSA